MSTARAAAAAGTGGGHRFGTVVGFDQEVGLGQVAAADGSVFDFHCTQIADGSRTIAPGARVSFEVVAAQLGRWEAGHLETVNPLA
jgi:cold shock CspA family protein